MHFSQLCTHERCKGYWAFRFDDGALGGVALAGVKAVIAFDTAFIAVALLFAVAAPLLVCIKMLLARMAGKQDAGQSHEGELPVSHRELSL